ncbi:MAG: hypothetical protein IPM92_13810 [Saprospiraceae bacterium]|nr:hypothetical protein [Saprospiraceae bacterium]
MKQIYLVLLLCLGISLGNAQYYYLPFIGAGQNPGGLNKDAEYPPGGGLPAGWTTILTGPRKSGDWSAIRNIGFPFKLNGIDVTQYKVNTSGVLTFATGDNTVIDSANTDLPNDKIPNRSILVWGLRCVAGDYVVTKTFGTAPNRQHWITYNSFGEENLKTGWIYISIVLEETTNKVYIVDQRTQCVNNGAVCQDKTSLTLGIQFDKTSAIQVQGSPNYQSVNTNNYLPDDNSYFEFVQGSQPDDDVLGVQHNLRKYYLTKDFPISFTGTFVNSGTSTITKLNYSYNINDGAVGSVSADIDNLNFAPLSKFTVTHPTPIAIANPGTYTIKSWVSKINNNDPIAVADDTIRSVIIVNDSAVLRKLMHENFSSSTCPPCKPGNEILHAVVSQYEGKYTELTYHFYFPGTGDPYYTSECAARSTYYAGINAIPATLLDGKININPNGYNTSIFEEWQGIPAFHTVSPSGTVTGQKIDIKVDVGALIPTSATTRLYVAVAEKVTYQNIKNNGETEFPHVMKKMIPDANGTVVGVIDANGSKTFNFTWTAPGAYRLPLDAQAANIINLATEHSIEEFNDLEVFAWLQETDKSILQSNVADLEFVVANDNPISLKEVKAYPSLASDYFFVDMSAFEDSEELKIMVANETGNIIHAEKTGLKSLFINASSWTAGLYYVKVVGKNAEGLQKVMIVK